MKQRFRLRPKPTETRAAVNARLAASVVSRLLERGHRDLATAVGAGPTSPPMPFKLGDEVLYGKYKNHRGRIIQFGRNPKGQITVQIEPIPKGRKKTKEMGLFKIWTTPDAIEGVTK